MTTSSFIHPLVHVNRSDRSTDPFCSCHDDPWALCPRWQEWGVTAQERAEAQERAATAMAYFDEQAQALKRQADGR